MGTPRKVYNAAFLLQPDGSTGGVYRKVHLVPFGEYVPLKRILFFAAPLVEAVSDFSPGARVNTLPVGDSRISTAICYEVVYPALIREGVQEGSALLTTITNDAWFGQSSAPWQHFQMATMRAIEQGRYLVRSANTGISGVVDPYGRVLAASPLFVEWQRTMDVRLIEDRTVYSRIGDVVAWVSVLITAVALILAARPAENQWDLAQAKAWAYDRTVMYVASVMLTSGPSFSSGITRKGALRGVRAGRAGEAVSGSREAGG